MPPVAEGVDFRASILFKYTDLTFNGLYRHLQLYRVRQLPSASRLSKGLAGLWIVTVAVLAAVVPRKNPPIRYTLTFAIVAAFVIKLVLPHRYDYAEILHLAPLALIIPFLVARNSSSSLILPLILTGLAAGPIQGYGPILRCLLLICAYTFALCNIAGWRDPSIEHTGRAIS